MTPTPTEKALSLLMKRRDKEKLRGAKIEEAQNIREEIYNLTIDIKNLQTQMDDQVEKMASRRNFKLNPIAIKVK